MTQQLTSNTEEWLHWRRRHVGASDQTHLNYAASWSKGAAWLWDIKKQKIPELEINFAMQRGLDLESEARLAYSLKTDIEVFPAIMESSEYPFLSASLDGQSDEGRIIEIKCPNKNDHAIALAGEIPNKYIPQLCHQMFVAEQERVDYVSFDGDTLAVVPFYRDERLVKEIIDVALWFWDFVEMDVRPDYEKPHPLFDTRTPVLTDVLLLEEAKNNYEIRKKMEHLETLLLFSNQTLLDNCRLPKAKIGNIQIVNGKSGRFVKLLKGE